MNIETIFNQGLTYSQYRNLVDKLVLEGKTTGDTQSSQLTEFTKLNVQRMNRLDKTIHVPEFTNRVNQPVTEPMLWLVVGDAWCGDSAQVIPVLHKIAESSGGKISLRIIARDTYPELLQQYAHGSKSIPKLLILDPNTYQVRCTWGPRPKPAKEIAKRWKESKGLISHEDFEKELHLWYSRDKGATTINEILNLSENCEKKNKDSEVLEFN